MSAPARITQEDMNRATKAIAASGLACERIIMDFANQRIEVIMAGSTGGANMTPANPWKGK